MAQGKDPFSTGFAIPDHDIDNDDDEREVYYYEYGQDFDNDEDEQEVDTTRPFYPGASSTPYHGGEQHEMQTMMHGQSGLPDTSYETPLRRTGSITDLQLESAIRQKNEKGC